MHSNSVAPIKRANASKDATDVVAVDVGQCEVRKLSKAVRVKTNSYEKNCLTEQVLKTPFTTCCPLDHALCHASVAGGGIPPLGLVVTAAETAFPAEPRGTVPRVRAGR